MASLPVAIERALYRVTPGFPADARWAISCGTALALHGLNHRPLDLDVFAPRADAERLVGALRGLPVLFPFAPRRSGTLSSFWGRFLAEGVEVDVVGDFSLGPDVTLDARHPCWDRVERVRVGNRVVRVLAIRDLLEFYEAFPGEERKVRLLRTVPEDGLSSRP